MQEALKNILESIPYCKHLGLEPSFENETLILKMPFKQSLIGNPFIPAIHGGTLAALMEITAICELQIALKTEKMPKTINVSVDYLRSGKPIDTFAQAKIYKLGRRVVNIETIAWQTEIERPIAKLQANFLIAEELV